MSRAEVYESQRNRLVASCFSRQDANGQLAEAYVTHLSIIEDAQYPSSPPPPESAADNKKPRLIIIAVRSSGRVRMHKARENNNGSFSIGKTWNMEELSVIESFSNTSMPAQNERDAQHRAWAGELGFTVTITKPYYWEAKTSKEKDFFIASAVKIYRKYTRGQTPELKGFSEAEIATLLGNQAVPTVPSLSPTDNRQSPAPPQPPFARRPQSRDESQYRQSPGPPPESAPGSRQASESPARFGPLSPPSGPRQYGSNDQLRTANLDGGRPDYRPGTSPGPGHRAPPIPRPNPQSPQSSTSPFRNQSPASNGRDFASPPPPRPSLPHIPARSGFPPPRPVDGMAATRQAEAGQKSDGNHRGRDSNGSSRPRSGEPRREHIPGSAPQIPPLHTLDNFTNGSDRDRAGSVPLTATTVSSPGIDLADAAAVGAITSFWAPDPNRKPSEGGLSPPTPERSRKRPPFEAKVSDNSNDLRPAPLNQIRKATHDGPDRAAPPSDVSGAGTPQLEESPEIRPLQIQSKSEPQPDHIKSPVSPQATSQKASTPRDLTPADPDENDAAQEDGEQYRPGLGPMIKKKIVADRFRKAATAANAFKPRPGGAADKILKARAEREAGAPDGISGVVPRPTARQNPSDATDGAVPEDLSVKAPVRDETPKVEIFSPGGGEQAQLEAEYSTGAPRGVELVDDAASHLHPPTREEEAVQVERVEDQKIRQPHVKIKRRSMQQEKYLAEIGIDRSLLDGRGIEFEMVLTDFGWNAALLQPKSLAMLESDIRREQGRVEAGSWLSHTDAAREERVAHVENLLDKAIAECDELEGLLTLYKVELNTLSDDIAFIEAQSQGLQVQSANQKLLQTELRHLIDIMSLDKRVTEPLKWGDLSSPGSLEEIEGSLVRLYQAMLTMDPSATVSGRRRFGSSTGEQSMPGMQALREKKIDYDRVSNDFCQRLMQVLDSKFDNSMNGAKDRVLRAPGNGGTAKLHGEAFTEARSVLWMYSPLILYTKEINPPAWQTLFRMYHTRAKPLYADAFRQNISNWKRAARAPTGDESDILFTAQEKEEVGGGLSSTARKLTVKRTHTLAKTWRTASDKSGHADTRQPGAMMRCAVFAGALDEMAPLMSREQNFIVDLFHATSLETTDFVDSVHAVPPGKRHGTNLTDQRPAEPDREMARRVANTMSDIFSFFADEISALLDWSISDDPLQGVGTLSSLSRHSFYLQDGNQEYLLQIVESLLSRLQNRFAKFVDEQVRAIEDTKVKIKKRKGVIAFMKTFPLFSSAVENVFSNVAGHDYLGPSDCVLEVRRLIDNAYERINRAMFDSLKVIAKESPGAGGGGHAHGHAPAHPPARGGGDDPEDKAMLNYHILLIENMNHYVEDVDDGGRPGVLADWKGRALMERSEALDAYVTRVIRRPLGKLLDFLESAESILLSNPDNAGAVSARPSHSRKAIRSVLAQHDAKEIRRGIDTLRRRIEKHFGEADEEAISRSLVVFVCKECERTYEKAYDRLDTLVRDVYPLVEGEKSIEIDFTKADIQAGFRR